MRHLLYTSIFMIAFASNALAEDKVEHSKTGSKEVPQMEGVITQPKIALDIREKMIADKELELAAKEKKINEEMQEVAVSRKQLVQEALNVKNALNAREKEITQKIAASPKAKKKNYPDATKKLGDLINSVSEKNPVKND